LGSRSRRARYVYRTQGRKIGHGVVNLDADGRHPPGVSLATAGQGNYVVKDSAIHDINDRRRTEEALRINEERFPVALKSSPVVVFNRGLVRLHLDQFAGPLTLRSCQKPRALASAKLVTVCYRATGSKQHLH
jgi:PAS domain-containing protein